VGFGEGTTEGTGSSHGTRIAAVAVDCGIPAGQVSEVDTLEALRRAIEEPGPWLIVADIDSSDATDSPTRRRPGVDVVESPIMFKRQIVNRGHESVPNA
jgi:thiamine pyrophosphate-dependent acetolactate synthase large subunit-like protein